jgi:anaerobic magnesium-protoporphyrin IX monomethyl ester cyclase
MKWALINPRWSFEGSIYFGCRDPHLPLEFGYAKALLEREGHEVRIVDAQLQGLSLDSVRAELLAMQPDISVITTAPSYLFWRCAPPELRIPQQTIRAVRDVGGALIGVGPHGSTTPHAALRKLDVDAVVLGECEEVLLDLSRIRRSEWAAVPSVCIPGEKIRGGPRSSSMQYLPALRWEPQTIELHRHHHHRFETRPMGPGAEMEFSRGCPYHCTFCAKENFRSDFRKRPLNTVTEELDGLIAAGAQYVYFIDEIFMPDKELLEALVARPIQFGVQMRIDLWPPAMLELLGRAGCVSIEAGVESITEEGRGQLAKKCKMSTEELAERLITAKKFVPFVQANLLESRMDNPAEIEAWRTNLIKHGVWANKPVPLFPYPGSPDYTLRWGLPDDRAWERAHDYYLGLFTDFSDIQEERPLPLAELESALG